MWMEYLMYYDFTLHYHFGKENMGADAVNRKSWGVLVSVASWEWKMLEVVGRFGLHYRGQAHDTLGILWLAFPTKQSDQVPRTRHRDNVHQGLYTVGYR